MMDELKFLCCMSWHQPWKHTEGTWGGGGNFCPNFNCHYLQRKKGAIGPQSWPLECMVDIQLCMKYYNTSVHEKKYETTRNSIEKIYN